MHILILNWRDIRNPHSGGAEILTQEMASRWVKNGHRVTHISARFTGSAGSETIDGVKILRMGSSMLSLTAMPVHIMALFHVLKHRSSYDVIIDEVHGIPFFSRLYTSKPIVLLVCEVAQNIWDVLFSFPINRVGRFIESQYLKFYPSVPVLTISPSTKIDIQSLGVSANRVTVLPMGITIPSGLKRQKKEKNTTLLFVARMSRAKGVEDAIDVLYAVRKHDSTTVLWIVGRKQPSYYLQLKKQIDRLKLTKYVRFFDFVPEKKKFELMGKAHVLIVPSYREGFGLTVPEAGHMYTPSVVYDVPGLRDIVRDGESGLVVEPSPASMAQALCTMLDQKKKYQLYQRHAHAESKQYRWENTAQSALRVLSDAVNR